MILKNSLFIPCEHGDKTCPYKAKTQADCHKICKCRDDKANERSKGNDK